jgi:hypothetical protein
MLANPSFELPGPGGQTFGGWNELGSVVRTTTANHGRYAAQVSGPSSETWDISGLWQRLDSEPGERWAASVRVWHSPINPLRGQSLAIVNIEWRDGDGDLIDYESHVAADSSHPAGEVRTFAVQSQPAPDGTVATRILIGVLQSPTDSISRVYYDQVTFDSLSPPTLDERQWADFPGGRTLEFSGFVWRVKGPGYYGPGPNLFCDSPSCTWIDAQGRMHLTIQNVGGAWYSTEVTLEESVGYGDYIFTTVGGLDDFHPNVVLGLFLWQYGPCYDPAYLWWNPYNEIDVEFSRWGDPSRDVGQFVAQPYDYPGNISRFGVSVGRTELMSHAFRWLPDRVEYRSWRGGVADESPENLVHSWTYTGPHLPRTEQPRVHINLWQFDGPPGSDQELILDAFTFIPACPTPYCDDSPTTASPTAAVRGHLSPATPNPFNPTTTIRYSLPRASNVELVIFDLAGRPVRTLVRGFLRDGEYEVTWNGRNDEGVAVASGVYHYRLTAKGLDESRPMVLLR